MSKYNHVHADRAKIVHLLPGRVRMFVPRLKGNWLMASVINQKMTEMAGVRQARANPLTGRVLVVFNETQIRPNNLIKTINDINNEPEFEFHLPPKNNQASASTLKKLQEPEDLPISEQLLNVAMGGGILAYLGLKRVLFGRSSLAENPGIFNLAAITAIVSGYPVLHSGFQSLVKGRINHDLLMGTIALGTVFLRESIPGLLVIWLVNLTALGQSLVLRSYRNALPELPETTGKPAQKQEKLTIPRWSEAGQEYGRKAVLPVFGLASLSGIAGGAGGFQRWLAMLLAANPSPAGLAAPTAATAAMAGAGKKGILYRDEHTLEVLSAVDTVVITSAKTLSEASYQVADILPAPGITKKELLDLAAEASCQMDNHHCLVLRKALAARVYRLRSTNNSPGASGRILAGDEHILTAGGIDSRWFFSKARRLRHLGQLPVFIATHGRLAGLLGIKRYRAADLRELVNGLRALGISNIGLTVEEDNNVLRQSAHELGIHHVWPGLTTQNTVAEIGNLKRQVKKIALLMGDTDDSPLLQVADVSICLASNLKCNSVDVVISKPALLPEVFRMARIGRLRAKQNLALVLAANVAGLALGATGRMPPMAASVYNNLISVFVGANSLRLLSGKPRHPRNHCRSLPTARKEIAAALALADNYPKTLQQEHRQKYSFNDLHKLSVAEALSKLKTDLESGLDKPQVLQRMNLFGPNKLAEAKPQGFLSRIWDQLKDFLVKALMASSAVCIVMGEFNDALAIVTILILNAVLGALQEQKAEGALEALDKMTAPTAKVRRSGKVRRLPAAELVPGDIVLLEQGDGVPADLRLVEVHGLEIEESALTGEPYPIPKKADLITDCVALLDCDNLAFMGTNVTRGRAVGLVSATGMSTEIGKIAGMLNEHKREPTPLQNRMTAVGGVILKYSLAASGLVALAGVLRGGSLFQMFLAGVSLAVAAIPEGLPAVVTIAMASGVKRMAKENAVVRRLPAVETLGSATLICTDKTGTLTQNRQQVQSVYTSSGWWQTQPGERQLKPVQTGNNDPQDLVSLLTAGILCNDASLHWSQNKPAGKTKPQWQVEGDPTEGALLLAALQEGLNYKEIQEKWQRIRELPFDAERLRMTVICREKSLDYAAFVKGAPEVVLGLCPQMQQQGRIVPLDGASRQAVLEASERMAGDAMRVLAIAYRPLSDPDLPDPEQSLILLGLAGMVDPPRPEVGNAIATCHRAGIKVAMITGDHPNTALTIAKKLGIAESGNVLTGRDIESLNDLELATAVREVRVFARVLPAHKLRLVKAFRQQGEILAMVGDGVNDAPAVKEGDIGVAMGRTGTDVTKQAADIVLLDDNFATLVSAVEQGRGIYSNIKRSARYLLSTNAGEVLLMFLSVLLGLPMPLLPIQLLFLNLLGDGLPALALGVEPLAKDLMDQAPRPANQSFFDEGLNTQIASRGVSLGLVGLGAYHWALKQGNLSRARTVALATITSGQLLAALECGERKEGKSSHFLAGSVALSAALLAGAIYLPFGRGIFKTSPLGLMDAAVALGTSGLTSIMDRAIADLWRGSIPSKKPLMPAIKEKAESCQD
ncbi:cation-translocating P-type ATPase [Pelotomaculum isophthalicicum JI]|uniref:Cation-translocating P-type ATPase n=1 Tax=Pelotomaculum isophthalicicum JI TaxID=947010 RepID=A0A9X4H4M8_9FIRM|nr:HAD-IC family P-type ATPase [Pelotomaculum isophthalicicum]MDF9408868.1 cation-translocating P-type ATPase [Pelotomaculum isophthalicicum JI]